MKTIEKVNNDDNTQMNYSNGPEVSPLR